jgi:two-component system sensor histidine kinase BarA
MGLVLVTFAAALALAHGIGRRLSGAIREAAQAILLIKGGHLDVRLPHTETNEIGTLQEGVNLLAEAIANAKERLEAELAKVRGEYSQVLAALQRQTHEAKQANHAKSLFLAKVSHEMRTPLYSIQGLGEQLLKSQHDADALRQLRTLLSATHQLHRIISDILDFTHLESGKYTPLITVLKPWAEIEHCLETISSLMSRQNLYVDVIVHADVPATVMGDAKAFRTIVANLMANAVKFTDAGGICVQLTREAVQPDGTHNLQLQVSDTGCGIPPEKRQVIFAPFEQVESALNRRYEGTGLGLSIVKGYCDVLGGRNQVESRPGQGSTFTISLPFRALDTRHAPAASAVDKTINPRVLIADTRSTFCASIRCRLESLGAQVSERPVSPQTLAALTPPASPYDLLVVRDLLRFPEETLADLCQSLRHWARHVMCLHTRDDPSAFQRLRQQGNCLALWSGVSRSTLEEELKRLLSGEVPDDVGNPNLDKLRSHLDGKTVLVVEDFEINRHIMTDQLQYHGLQVVGAGDGDDAIAIVRQTALDLILMDIQMPGKDGIKAIEEIRALPAGSRLPILGFTASADKRTHQRIMAAGANGALIKPLSEEELITAVYQALMASPFLT